MTAGQTTALLPLTEREWQSQVCDLAELCGWEWAHWRPARTANGWRTPVSGTIGAGFCDLILAHPRRRRVLLVELKSDAGFVSAEQRAVHEILRASGLEVKVWRPRDWDLVVAALHEPSARASAASATSGATSAPAGRLALGSYLPSTRGGDG